MTATPFAFETDQTGPLAGVYVTRLEQPGRPVVVLDEALIQRLDATISALPRNCRGLVVASASERVFIAGADLKAISELDDAALDRYLAYGQRVFGRLSQLPFPTAAAINGAVLGGGLELAMHCDALIGAPPPAGADGAPGRPYPVGLPEAGLSICPGWGGTNLLPARIDPSTAITGTATGTPTNLFDQAAAAGLFDALCPTAASLLETAKRWVAAGGRHRVRSRRCASAAGSAGARARPGASRRLDAVRGEIARTRPRPGRSRRRSTRA